jgi:hypothetical protein
MMEQQQITLEQMEVMQEQMEEEQEDKSDEAMEDQAILPKEIMDGYGSPEQEERMNQHSFLHKAAFASNDTIRTTFLHPEELGRPLFTVRFMMDMEDIAHYYLDPILLEIKKKYGLEITNKIAEYFREKILNITHSGMSNKGFAMNLNVTRRMDMTRKKLKPSPTTQKGGEE